jgi:hypothetical protein
LPERLFNRLAPLPGKSLAVYLILYQRSLMETQNPVPLTNTRLDQSGLTRKQKACALVALEKAGLIRVERRGRNNPFIWLCDVRDDS